jgi:hypothetical protein
MIEDEYSLFIKDFASVTKDEWEELLELEIFVVCDVLHFNMISLLNIAEQVREEKKNLNFLCDC